MRTVRRLALLITMASAISQPLQAQTGGYVVAGWTEAHRDSGAPLTEAAKTPTKSLVPGFSVSTGSWIMRGLAVEGSVTVLRSQSFPWYFTYVFAGGTTSEIGSNRDVALTGGVRVAAIRHRNLRLDLIGGGGWTRHSATSVTVAECGSYFQLPCRPISPRESDRLSTWEPAVTFGVDAPIRASRRVAIVPSFRVLTIARRQWLTEYSHRGPRGGSGLMTTFGVGVMFGSWAETK